MQNSRILGLDLDGTLADHTFAKIAIARELGYTLSPPQTASAILRHIMQPEHYRTLQKRLYHDFAPHSPKTVGAEEALDELRVRGWDFLVISRRGGEDSQDLARQWVVQEYAGMIPSEQVFFVEEDAAKNTVAKEHGVLGYVDDQQEVLNYLASVKYRLLFDPFENFLTKTPPHIVLMHAWRELPQLLAPFE